MSTMAPQENLRGKPIGEILLRLGKLTAGQLNEALALSKQWGTPLGTQVTSSATRSNCSSPTTAVASPSSTITVSSTLWVCRGIWVPGPKIVMPVVTLFPCVLHLPISGRVLTPVPRSNVAAQRWWPLDVSVSCTVSRIRSSALRILPLTT